MTRPREERWRVVTEMSTSNLVVALQKLAKNVSVFKPSVRADVLAEAADRLTEYRQKERAES